MRRPALNQLQTLLLCKYFESTIQIRTNFSRNYVQGSTKLWEAPSNQLRGARGASAHACSTGLSTGRRLMPMTARCGAAAPCRGATTVRQLPHTRRVVERAQSACSCSCMRGHGRKLSCIGMRGCGRKRKGVDENSWQSRQLHRRFQRLTVWIVQSNVCRALAGCVERTAGHASVWIATSFACGCSCTHSVRSTQPSPSHHLSRVRQL